MVHAVENMAFVGDVPWHGLGTSITTDTPLKEIQAAAGLDWEVQIAPNHKADGTPIEASYYIERISDGAILGKCVTEMYKPVQNSQMFDFFKPFVEAKKLHIHTAGSLFDGAKVWAMATPNEGFTLDGDDTVVSNLVFTLDHRGIGANSCMFTPIRVVCNNTWQLAKDTARDVVKHNHKEVFDSEAMVTALGLFQKEFSNFEKLAKKMARKVLTGAEELEYFRAVFGSQGEKTDESGKVIHSQSVRKALALSRGKDISVKPTTDAKLKRDRLKEIERLMQEAVNTGKTTIDLSGIDAATEDPMATTGGQIVNAGHDLKSARADENAITVWGAFQTVTNIVDHNPLKANKSADRRLEVSLYGNIADHKAKALDAARELVAV